MTRELTVRVARKAVFIKLAMMVAIALLTMSCTSQRVENFRLFSEAMATYMNDRDINGYVKGKFSVAGVGEVIFCAQSGDNDVCSE